MVADETKIALIGKDISQINKDISEIKVSIKELAGVYVTREALAEVAKQTETRLGALETEMAQLKNPGFIQRYFPTAVITIAAVVIEFLLISYIQNLHCVSNCVK